MIIKRNIIKIIYIYTFIYINVLFSADPGDIIVTEIFYNSNSNLYKYIEIYNRTSNSIDLIDWVIEIDGIDYKINDSLYINYNDYVVFYSETGEFIDSTSQDFCSVLASHPIHNDCLHKKENLYWLKFSDLSSDIGSIIVKDISNNEIDRIAYDSTFSSFSNDILGKSAVFILDPSQSLSDSLNDINLYWKSSLQTSDWLWNGANYEYGSPLLGNYINPSINIELTSGHSSYLDINSGNFICLPESDGLPGGEVELKLFGTAVYGEVNSILDSLNWIISNNENEIDTNIIDIDDAIIFPIYLQQDIALDTNIYKISLSTTDINKFIGITDTTIYVYRENNFAPIIDSIKFDNNGIINIFEDDSLHLEAFVTDTELCSISCEIEDLYQPNLYFGIDGVSTHGSSGYYNDVESCFRWFSEDSVSQSKLDENTVYSKITSFVAGQIVPLDNISANDLSEDNKYYFLATDPFGDSDTSVVNVIVHNRNNPPEIIKLELDSLANVNLIAGYSMELNIINSEIQLVELDASGIVANSIFIGEVFDIDGDKQLSVSPIGISCQEGYENGYCVENNLIKTNMDMSLDSLSISFVIDDGRASPVAGTTANNLSSESILIIKNIKKIKSFINFETLNISSDNYYHLPEDTTLISSFAFNIDFELDDGQPYSINSENLNWSISVPDWLDWNEYEQRVIISGDKGSYIIDSLSINYNGETGLKLIINSNEDKAISGNYIIDIPIYIDQRNDSISPFILDHNLKEYSINSTTIDVINNIRYFRLPQDDETNSLVNPEKLRFKWRKNDIIDVDINPELNKDILYNLYYRLETYSDDKYFILLDSINYNDYPDDLIITVDIDMNSEFSFYIDSYQNLNKDNKSKLDIEGNTLYKWRVIAQNYTLDANKNDPAEISLNVDSTIYKIDLIQPEILDFNIIASDFSPSYYDIIWLTNGPFLTDSTFFEISDILNQFGTINQLNPRRITDDIYHFTGIFPYNISVASFEYSLQMHDRAMNSNNWSKIISYAYVDTNSETIFSTPSGLAKIIMNNNSLNKSTPVFFIEEELNIEHDKEDLFQITPAICFLNNNITLDTNSYIYFDIRDYLVHNIYNHQYTIIKNNNSDFQELHTINNNGILSAQINDLSNYSVYLDKSAIRSLPDKFCIKNNFPNPFNPKTTIPIEIPFSAKINATIYNILGQEVIVLLDGFQEAGYINLYWDGYNKYNQDVVSGIYLLQIIYGKKKYSHKLMLLK